MTSPLLTPEIVERAARALAKEEWNPREAPFEADRTYWMTSARAALEAVIPSLIETIERKPETCADARRASYAAGFNNAVEECAKVADASYDSKSLADRSPRHIARAIRKLGVDHE